MNADTPKLLSQRLASHTSDCLCPNCNDEPVYELIAKELERCAFALAQIPKNKLTPREELQLTTMINTAMSFAKTTRERDR